MNDRSANRTTKSRSAVTENSPRCEPWVIGTKPAKPRRGERDNAAGEREFSVAPPGLVPANTPNLRLKPWAVFLRDSVAATASQTMVSRPINSLGDRPKSTFCLRQLRVIFILNFSSSFANCEHGREQTS